MQQQRSFKESTRVIAKTYKIVKPLFQVRSYFYTQVCCLANNYEVAIAALYVYENEDPSQSLKMLSEKLGETSKLEHSNLIFPYSHVKDTFNDKNISLFFIRDYILPLRYYEKKPFTHIQLLQILHGALNSLNHLHIRNIVHGKISLSTCYLMKHQNQGNCKFALSVLDTSIFTEEDNLDGIEERLYQSEGQSLGHPVTFRDDLQSLVFVVMHLVAKGKLFTVQRFQIEWVTQLEFLRWKCCDFFKEMVKLVPPQLEILIELYTIAKSLRRDEKPDYLKLLRRVGQIIAGKSSKLLKKSADSSNSQEEESEREKTPSIDQKDINVEFRSQKRMEKISRFKDSSKQNQNATQDKKQQKFN